MIVSLRWSCAGLDLTTPVCTAFWVGSMDMSEGIYDRFGGSGSTTLPLVWLTMLAMRVGSGVVCRWAWWCVYGSGWVQSTPPSNWCQDCYFQWIEIDLLVLRVVVEVAGGHPVALTVSSFRAALYLCMKGTVFETMVTSFGWIRGGCSVRIDGVSG